MDRVHLNEFLARVQKTLGHDLRTPLGTIANYAAVLEAVLQSESEDVRRMAQCIRENAMDVAKMLEQTLGATLLAARTPAPTPFDAAALLAEVAKELAQEMHVLGDGTPVGDGAEPFDPALVAFAWKVFVDFVRSECPAMATRAWIARRDADGRSSLDLSMGREDDGAAAVPLGRSFGLALCRELVTVRGGALEVAGNAGAGATLRLKFPNEYAN